MKKEIKEELNDHAPLLSGMSRQPEGYKVPDDYFARMEADLWEQLKPAIKKVTESASQTVLIKKEIQEELNNHAPLLSGMPKQSEGYKVPDDYFARMEADLWKQLKPATKTVTESVSKASWLDGLIQQISWLLQPRMALQLASVALVILAGFFFMNRSATSQQTDVLADLTADEASAYVLANLDEFDTESLIELSFGEANFSEVDATFFNDADVDDLLDELQKENIDLQTLETYL